MPIKLIAVDMDGTFLNNNQDYNRERFRQQYTELKKRGIRFVVASGNQYYQLKSFFPDFADEISFVAENGAYIVHSNEEVFCGEMSENTVRKVLDILRDFQPSSLVVCGRNSAYVAHDTSEADFNKSLKYYHKLKRVDNLYTINDTIFKFALTFNESDVPEVLETLHESVGDFITPVTSGNIYIDLIIPGLHKAHGVKRIQELCHIEDHETVAFGDSGNDIEMLHHVAYGFAMENATEPVKSAANYMTDSNDEEGLFNTIDAILNKEYPFN